MKKAFFRADYQLGYRMSDGTQDLAFAKPNAENYYALALAVYENYSSGKALGAMGIAPEPERTYVIVDCPYKNMACGAYILHRVCGVQMNVITKLFRVSKKTVHKALRYAKENLSNVKIQTAATTA